MNGVFALEPKAFRPLATSVAASALLDLGRGRELENTASTVQRVAHVETGASELSHRHCRIRRTDGREVNVLAELLRDLGHVLHLFGRSAGDRLEGVQLALELTERRKALRERRDRNGTTEERTAGGQTSPRADRAERGWWPRHHEPGLLLGETLAFTLDLLALSGDAGLPQPDVGQEGLIFCDLGEKAELRAALVVALLSDCLGCEQVVFECVKALRLVMDCGLDLQATTVSRPGLLRPCRWPCSSGRSAKSFCF